MARLFKVVSIVKVLQHIAFSLADEVLEVFVHRYHPISDLSVLLERKLPDEGGIGKHREQENHGRLAIWYKRIAIRFVQRCVRIRKRVEI